MALKEFVKSPTSMWCEKSVVVINTDHISTIEPYIHGATGEYAEKYGAGRLKITMTDGRYFQVLPQPTAEWSF